MKNFDDRKRSQEASHAMTEEQRFIQTARAARQLAAWAGEKLSASSEEMQKIQERVIADSINGGSPVSLVAIILDGVATEAEVQAKYNALNTPQS